MGSWIFGREIQFQLVNGLVAAMHGHIFADGYIVVGGDPFKGRFQNLLPPWIARNVGLPFLHVGVLRIGENGLRRSDKFTGIDGVQEFQIVQGNARDADGLEPFLDFGFRTFTFIDEQFIVF